MIRNLRLISKFVMSRTGKQTITKDILPNILRSKGNQVMKFGQVIEYDIRNISLEKPYTKCVREASPRPFYKNSKLNIFLDQQSEIIYSLLLFYLKKDGLPRYINPLMHAVPKWSNTL